VPAVAAVGTSKPEQMIMPPFVLVPIRPTGVVAPIGVLSNFIVSPSFALNPEPVIARVALPSMLAVGVIWIVGDVTVMLVVAVFNAVSDTVRVYVPGR